MTSAPDPRARRRPAAALVAVLILLLAGCGSDREEVRDRDGAATERPPTAELEGLVRQPALDVSGATLPQVAADGSTTPFAFRADDGGLLFVAFGYTNCPDVCPTTLADVRKALAELGDDASRVDVAFATVDPERDTAEVMEAYLGSFVPDGHPLRTTDPAELAAAESAFEITSQVVEGDDGRIEVAHTARSFVVDDTGTVVVEWPFGTSFESMAADLTLLLARQR